MRVVGLILGTILVTYSCNNEEKLEPTGLTRAVNRVSDLYKQFSIAVRLLPVEINCSYVEEILETA